MITIAVAKGQVKVGHIIMGTLQTEFDSMPWKTQNLIESDKLLQLNVSIQVLCFVWLVDYLNSSELSLSVFSTLKNNLWERLPGFSRGLKNKQTKTTILSLEQENRKVDQGNKGKRKFDPKGVELLVRVNKQCRKLQSCFWVFFSSIHHFRTLVSFCWCELSKAPGMHWAPVALSDWQHHPTPREDVTDTTPLPTRRKCAEISITHTKGSSESSPENSTSLLMCRRSTALDHSRPVKTYFMPKWLGRIFVSHSEGAKFRDLISVNIHIYTHIRLWGRYQRHRNKSLLVNLLKPLAGEQFPVCHR